MVSAYEWTIFSHSSTGPCIPHITYNAMLPVSKKLEKLMVTSVNLTRKIPVENSRDIIPLIYNLVSWQMVLQKSRFRITPTTHTKVDPNSIIGQNEWQWLPLVSEWSSFPEGKNGSFNHSMHYYNNNSMLLPPLI